MTCSLRLASEKENRQSEPDLLLNRFIISVRKKSSEGYEPTTLSEIIAAATQ